MMRLSCLTLSYQNQFKAGKMDIFSFLSTCRALDLDGADIHIGSLKNTERPHLKEVRRRALDMGLSISCLGVSTEFGNALRNGPKVASEDSDWIAEFVAGSRSYSLSNWTWYLSE